MSQMRNRFLIDEFGEDRGNELYSLLFRDVEERMAAHTHEGKARQKALESMILPPISLYYLLQEQQGLTKDAFYGIIELPAS